MVYTDKVEEYQRNIKVMVKYYTVKYYIVKYYTFIKKDLFLTFMDVFATELVSTLALDHWADVPGELSTEQQSTGQLFRWLLINLTVNSSNKVKQSQIHTIILLSMGMYAILC